MDRFENLYKPIKKSLAMCFLGIAVLLYGPAPVWAQGLEDFAVLAGDAVTCTRSVVNGDLGVVDPGPFTVITFCTVGGTVNLDADLAYNDFLTAYFDLATVPPCQFTLVGGTLPAGPLAPGVYCADAAVTATGAVLTLDGTSDDTWIFRIGTLGTGALTGTNFAVVLASGETCSNNVTWWTAQAATLTDSVFLGSILAGADITVTGGALNGQALAGGTGTEFDPTGAVTLTDTGISVCDGGTPAAPANPLHDPIKVTGGGQVELYSSGQASFGFNAKPNEAGGAKGHFNYVNHMTGLHVEGPVTGIQVVAINDDDSPKTVRFSGICADLPACAFVVTVEDNGEPGVSDEIGISVAGDLSDVISQKVISQGNIQFHLEEDDL